MEGQWERNQKGWKAKRMEPENPQQVALLANLSPSELPAGAEAPQARRSPTQANWCRAEPELTNRLIHLLAVCYLQALHHLLCSLLQKAAAARGRRPACHPPAAPIPSCSEGRLLVGRSRGREGESSSHSLVAQHPSWHCCRGYQARPRPRSLNSVCLLTSERL